MSVPSKKHPPEPRESEKHENHFSRRVPWHEKWAIGLSWPRPGAQKHWNQGIGERCGLGVFETPGVYQFSTYPFGAPTTVLSKLASFAVGLSCIPIAIATSAGP